MTHYSVHWEISLDAENPEEAAREALIVMQDTDPANICHVFDVSPWGSNMVKTIDLDEIGWKKEVEDSELIL
jgi:hypothetical protein